MAIFRSIQCTAFNHFSTWHNKNRFFFCREFYFKTIKLNAALTTVRTTKRHTQCIWCIQTRHLFGCALLLLFINSKTKTMKMLNKRTICWKCLSSLALEVNKAILHMSKLVREKHTKVQLKHCFIYCQLSKSTKDIDWLEIKQKQWPATNFRVSFFSRFFFFLM